MSDCNWFVPWDQYDSWCVKIAECIHWSGDDCQRHDTPDPCPKPWLKEKKEVRP